MDFGGQTGCGDATAATPLIIAMFSCSILLAACCRPVAPSARSTISGAVDRLMPRFDVARQRHVVPGWWIPITRRAVMHVRRDRGAKARMAGRAGPNLVMKTGMAGMVGTCHATVMATGQDDVSSLAASW